MTRHFKDWLKHFLAERGYTLSWNACDSIDGQHLARDLRLLIGQKHPVCLDVGANKGQTLEMLTSALDAPVIHAFEPAPEQFRWLEQHWQRPGVHLHSVALGSRNSSAEMNLYDVTELNSLLPLQGTTTGALPQVSRIGSTTVQTVTLDSLFASLNIAHVDLLKIDTQGYDFEVLKGAARLLSERRIRHVLVELNYIALYAGQCSPWEVESFLAGHGFRLVDLYEKIRTRTTIDWCTALFQHCAV